MSDRHRVDLSVVVPVFNEEGNVTSLVKEIEGVLAGLLPLASEIIVVNDASTDGTLPVLRRILPRCPRLRVLRHARRSGQSAALATGFDAARGAIVVTLDGDGQNDPADIPGMLAALQTHDVVCGVRARRADSWVRRASSRVGNAYRRCFTGDTLRDSGCAMRVLRAEVLKEVPVFNGMHRFLPTLLIIAGWRVGEVPVNHRARLSGQTKYGVGNRLMRGVFDCAAMLWWRRRVCSARRSGGEEPRSRAPPRGGKAAPGSRHRPVSTRSAKPVSVAATETARVGS